MSEQNNAVFCPGKVYFGFFCIISLGKQLSSVYETEAVLDRWFLLTFLALSSSFYKTGASYGPQFYLETFSTVQVV